MYFRYHCVCVSIWLFCSSCFICCSPWDLEMFKIIIKCFYCHIFICVSSITVLTQKCCLINPVLLNSQHFAGYSPGSARWNPQQMLLPVSPWRRLRWWCHTPSGWRCSGLDSATWPTSWSYWSTSPWSHNVHYTHIITHKDYYSYTIISALLMIMITT